MVASHICKASKAQPFLIKAVCFQNVFTSPHRCLRANSALTNNHISMLLACFSQTQCRRKFSSSPCLPLLWDIKNTNVTYFQEGSNLPLHDGLSLLDRYIFVKTLVNLYEDVPDGIILDAAYADSRPGEDYDPAVPVIVGIHDTPGSHADLLPILSTFAKVGCRTIAPTFPGHGNTQGLMRGFDDVFSHSTLERAMFLQDFLDTLGIEKVDLMIGVGAGCYPTLRLCAGSESYDMYKSMALISPWPLKRPRYEANSDLIKSIQFMWDRPFFRLPAKLLLPAYKVGNVQTVREKLTSAYLLGNLDLAEASSLAFTAVTLNLPRLLLFGDLDPEVEPELYLDFAQQLEIPPENIRAFSGKLGVPVLPGALSFTDGGYNLHLEHPGIISAYLMNLVQLFRPHIHF
ncbi:hydrolase/acyltransferase-like protein [Plakobranchus ocellatus]|uniref:Hydrolase/acyltransferase-like protein n=1 Tax=Plakobranchus ocellatus TaxID=259542 RepID=A0AAV4C221_9GAST|nr:hydrolase/acyltransferase-like protein [Plakobranchus ocellatus]